MQKKSASQCEEDSLITFHRSAGATVVAFAALALISGPAAAAKKMTYADAFAKCKQEISSAGVPGTGLSVAAGSSAGGACMHKYGFRLKKKDKM
jgi:hypothetical protein